MSHATLASPCCRALGMKRRLSLRQVRVLVEAHLAEALVCSSSTCLTQRVLHRLLLHRQLHHCGARAPHGATQRSTAAVHWAPFDLKA
ncbi:hypothetical protein EYF80_060480 [Liparis tanakae]|uniref:Uncharacterized protein n=1 Tax=Liparis tanakae TaxID=230148 RepID=A0A4Z2EKM5_9TELE|nr:hypothetical protein EYF80_060480 [Liparis tanakae]